MNYETKKKFDALCVGICLGIATAIVVVALAHGAEGKTVGLTVKVKLVGCGERDCSDLVVKVDGKKQSSSGEDVTFKGLNIPINEDFEVCVDNKVTDNYECNSGVNGPEKEPETVKVKVK